MLLCGQRSEEILSGPKKHIAKISGPKKHIATPCISEWLDNLATELFNAISTSNKTTPGIVSLFVTLNKQFMMLSKEILVRLVKQTLKDTAISKIG